jgi:hypothetical protein
MSGWNQEQEYQAGVRAERERIIKLLEVWWETDQELEELIDIIKGENNG